MDHPSDSLPTDDGRGRQGVCQTQVRDAQWRATQLDHKKDELENILSSIELSAERTAGQSLYFYNFFYNWENVTVRVGVSTVTNQMGTASCLMYRTSLSLVFILEKKTFICLGLVIVHWESGCCEVHFFSFRNAKSIGRDSSGCI